MQLNRSLNGPEVDELPVCSAHFNDHSFVTIQQVLYWLTREGSEVAVETLAVPKTINRVTYFHDTMLVDLAEALVSKTGGEFVPERRLRAELKAEGQRILTHLPDGHLYLDDKKPIAIELELSLKAADRLRAPQSPMTGLRF